MSRMLKALQQLEAQANKSHPEAEPPAGDARGSTASEPPRKTDQAREESPADTPAADTLQHEPAKAHSDDAPPSKSAVEDTATRPAGAVDSPATRLEPEPSPTATAGVLELFTAIQEIDTRLTQVLVTQEQHDTAPVVKSPDLPPRRPRPPSELEETVRDNLSDDCMAQQYRELAERIVAQLPEAAPAAVLLVAAEQQPHVPIAVAHVAMTLADRAEGQVLILDANLSNKYLSGKAGLKDKPGLVEAISGGKSWQDLVVATASEHLDILPAGRGLSLKLSSIANDLTWLMGRLKGRYRFILIDAGPVATRAADAMARVCDGTFLLVRLGQTETADAASAMTSLQSAGSRVLGCVVTNVPPDRQAPPRHRQRRRPGCLVDTPCPGAGPHPRSRSAQLSRRYSTSTV